MTTKDSQMTTNGGQDAAELHRQIEALGQELRQKTAECDKLRILIHKVAASFRDAVKDEESDKAFCLAFSELLKEDKGD